MTPMRIVMLGAPGSGKGTQTQMLERRYGAVPLSTGDLLRAAVAQRSLIGRRARAAMESGSLVSDEIVLGLIREHIAAADAPEDFVLDGFPRNIAQATALEALLEELGKPLDAALQIEVAREVLWRRISGRRSCRQCGAVYNVYTSAPRREGRCDRCGGELYQRDDDTERTVEKRLRTYEEQTAPVVDFYRARGLLVRVNGEASPQAVFERISERLAQRVV